MTNKPDILLSMLAIGESPRWHQNRLWFCNWGRQEVIAVDMNRNTEVMLYTPFTSFPFSIDWLPNGQLLITSSSEQILWRMADDGSLVAHSDLSAFDKTWNEIVVDARGNAYINGVAGIILSIIEHDRGCFACALGGKEMKTCLTSNLQDRY